MSDINGRTIKSCQSCYSKDIIKFLSLGNLPIANDIYKINSDVTSQFFYPLDLLFCRKCSLIQIGFEIKPEIVFPKNFPYTSSSTKALRDNFEKLSKICIERFRLNKNDLVLDIGSNDGNLLGYFKDFSKVLGVTPEDIGKIAIQKGIPTIIDYFNKNVSDRIIKENGKAKIVTSTNTFAHIPDVNGFVQSVCNLLKNDGVFITENHYFVDLQKTFQFDTIYHEHLRYYSVKSLKFILEKNNFEIFDVEKIKTHGGSIRVYACKKNTFPISENVNKIIDSENEIISEQKLNIFSSEIDRKKQKLFNLLKKIKANNSSIFGIGAAARASTLINSTGIKKFIDKVLEIKGSKKIGFYMSGTKIPIFDEEILLKEKPDYLILLSWHISDILIKNLKQKNFKGKFIVPLPEPTIIE